MVNEINNLALLFSVYLLNPNATFTNMTRDEMDINIWKEERRLYSRQVQTSHTQSDVIIITEEKQSLLETLNENLILWSPVCELWRMATFLLKGNWIYFSLKPWPSLFLCSLSLEFKLYCLISFTHETVLLDRIAEKESSPIFPRNKI